MHEYTSQAKTVEPHTATTKSIDGQQACAKLTTSERLDFLLDAGTFSRTGIIPYPLSDTNSSDTGIVTGYGQIDGRLVYVFLLDCGALNEPYSIGWIYVTQLCEIIDMALKQGAPIIGLYDTTSAYSQASPASLNLYNDLFLRNTRASGVIPQISVVMGQCTGSAAYSTALTDFTFVLQHKGNLCISEANDCDDSKLAYVKGFHNEADGLAHFTYATEWNCINGIRQLISYIPSNNLETPPRIMCIDSPMRAEKYLNSIIPDSPKKPYNMRMIIQAIFDEGECFEIQEHFATNILVGFARLNGRSIGFVASQPEVLAGVLDIDASTKAARFIRFCDCFNIPIISLLDVPGFLPGVHLEHSGIIRHGSKLVYAYCEATVPKITIIIRKAYGGSYVMGSKQMRADINYAWPTAEIAVMGPDAAVNILFRQKIEKAENPQETRAKLIEEYTKKFAHPYIAASLGYIDAVIEPCYTRDKIISALEMLINKKDENPPKKHGNIPL